MSFTQPLELGYRSDHGGSLLDVQQGGKETRRAAPFRSRRFPRGGCCPVGSLLEIAFCASTSWGRKSATRALGFASQIVKPPSETTGIRRTSVEKRPFRSEHVHEAPVIGAPDGGPTPCLMVSNEIEVVHHQPLAALPAVSRVIRSQADVLDDRLATRPAPLPGESGVVAVDAPERLRSPRRRATVNSSAVDRHPS